MKLREGIAVLVARVSRKDRSIDETGNRYGKLLVIEKYSKGGANEHVKWLCRCDCGNVQPVCGTYLRTGIRTMCNACAAKAREETPKEQKWVSNKGRPEGSIYDSKMLNAESTINRIRKLWNVLQVGEQYMIVLHFLHEETRQIKCTLVAKYQKFAVFRTAHGIYHCFSYHAIMTEEIVFTDELVPRRVTA